MANRSRSRSRGRSRTRSESPLTRIERQLLGLTDGSSTDDWESEHKPGSKPKPVAKKPIMRKRIKVAAAFE